MGGKRQANILSAIISNFDIVEDVIETSLNSQNSAIKENEKYLDSIQGRLDKFNNATQTMWSNFIGTELIKGFVDIGTTFIETLNKIGGTASTVAVAIGGLAASIISMSAAQAATKDIGLITALKKNFTDFFDATKAGFVKLWQFIKSPAGGMTIAATVIAVIFDALHTTAQEAADKAHEAFTEISSALSETKSTVESMENELEGLSKQIDALDGKKLSFAEEEELKRLKQQRAELEQSLKTQQQILELQQQATNKSAIAAMKAYTKASSAGAEETIKKHKTAWSIIGAGVLTAVAAALIVPTAGVSAAILPALAAGGAGALLGNKIGEATGSGASKNDGSYDSWYSTYTKAIEAAQAEEQKALEEYEKDTSNIDKLDKWQEMQKKTADIETEMYEHVNQMQSYYNNIEYGQSTEIDKELDAWHNFLDKMSIDNNASGAKANAIDRLFGENASANAQELKENIQAAAEVGKSIDFTVADAKFLGLDDDLKYLGISVEDVTKHFTQLGEEAANAISKIDFSDAIASLAKIEDIFGSLSSAMEEFMSDGSASATTLNGMVEEFGDLDSWDRYVETMLSGTATKQDAVNAGAALAKEFLDGISDTITKDNKLGFVEALEKVGVKNANEIVDSYINNNFLDSSIIDRYSVGFKQLDPLGKTKRKEGFISAVNEEYGVLLSSIDAINLLVKSDKVRTQRATKYAEERKQAEIDAAKVAKQEQEELKNEIVAKLPTFKTYNGAGLEYYYNQLLDIQNGDSRFKNYTEDALKDTYSNAVNQLTEWLPTYGYTFEQLFPEEITIDTDVDFTYTDDDIAQAQKDLQDKIESLKLNVPIEIDFDVKDHIEDMAYIEDATNALGEVYKELKENKEVSAGTLAGLSDTFNIVGTKEEYEDFVNILSTAKSITPEVTTAFNELVGAWISSSGVLDEVNEKTRAQTVEFLERYGILNAQAVVEKKIATDKVKSDIEALLSTQEVTEATYDEVEAIAAEAGMAEIYQDVLRDVDYYKELYGIKDITSVTKNEADALVEAASAAKFYGDQLARAQEIQGLVGDRDAMQEQVDANNKALTDLGTPVATRDYYIRSTQLIAKNALLQKQIDAKDEEIEAKINDLQSQEVETTFAVNFEVNTNLSDLGSKKYNDKENKKLLDFIEIKLEEIENTISKCTSELENAIDNTSASSLSDKDAIYDKLIDAQRQKADINQQAYDKYAEHAASLLAQIPVEYRAMAQEGSIKVEDFVGDDRTDIAEAIEEYREWDDKADKAEINALGAIAEISALRLQQIQDISDDFDNAISLIEGKSNLLESNIDLAEAQGMRISTKFYEQLKADANAMLNNLTNKRNAMDSALSNAVSRGEIRVGSDDWYDAVNAIYEVDEAIVQCKIDAEEFNNAIQDIKWGNFDKLITELDNIGSQISHLYGVMSDDADVVDEFGNWTDDGYASLGLLAQQMELAQYNAEEYGNAIKELEANKSSYSDDEYNEKLAELTEKQWESIEAYEQAKKEVVDLNKVRVDAIKKGIKEEIDAYKELIDLKKESLNEDKEARDFAKNVAEKEKNIANIERQLAAIGNNNSAEAVAKRKQLQAELAEARADLDDFYYDHSIETQQKALDDEAKAFEQNKQDEMDKLDEWLENSETVIGETLDLVQNKADNVLSAINNVAEIYGVSISEAITAPWIAGGNAIDDYENKFNGLASKFGEQLDNIKKKQEEIVQKGNAYANNVISSIYGGSGIPSNTFTGISSDYNAGYAGMSQADFDAIKQLEEDWQKAYEAGDRAGMDAAHASAEAIRSQYGYSGGSDGSKYISTGSGSKSSSTAADANSDYYAGQVGMSKEDFDDLQQLKEDWEQANKAGDTAGMQEAHTAAEAIRKKYGYSGGGDGSNYIPHYAKGTSGTKKSGLAIIDEMGLEEIVMHAGSDGRLQYLSKGSTVIPHDISENLIKLGQLDPRSVLENSKVALGAPHVTTNNMEINMQISEVVHIDHADSDSVPDITQAVQTQMDKYMKSINNALKKKIR